MFSNYFSVRIPEGTEVEGGYVKLRHEQTYSIVMRNSNPARCDAQVSIDGEIVGTWRIASRATIRIERPADKTRLFTFYRFGSIEAGQAGLVDNEKLGLISVTFKPEKAAPPWSNWSTPLLSDIGPVPRSAGKGGVGGCSAGGTGLSGHSQQSFSSTAPLDYDPAAEYTIHLRLIAVENVAKIEPLVSRSTPVPPRV